MPTFRLTKRVQIEQRSEPMNDFAPGDPGAEPQPVTLAWAQMDALSATERVVANQVFPTATYKAIIRWPGTNIEPRMWLIANERRFEILSVVEMDGRYLELTLGTEHTGVGTETLR